MLPFIVAGLTLGSVFALAAVGLVLTYKTSGIFNFAHGALASLAAFAFYYLRDLQGLPWPAAAALVVLLGSPLVGWLLASVVERLAKATLPMKVVAMVGVLLAIQGGLQLLLPPGQIRQVQPFLPDETFQVFGTPVSVGQTIVFGIGVVATVGLTVYLRIARMGVSMRAVVDDSELLDLTGVAPQRVRRFAWGIGSMLAGASGVLIAPMLPLDATSITFLVVTAFGAAAIGRFTSLPWTYAGGLVIGVGQALLQKWFVAAEGITAGLASSLPFLVLFGLLVVAPRLSRPGGAEPLDRSTVAPWRPPMSARLLGLLVLTVVLVMVPSFAQDQIFAWTRTLALVVVFLSLGLLVRTSGQVSLAHVTFMAIGAAGFSRLAVDQGWPWLAAALAAALVAAPIGAVLAIPAIRFPGVYLALATLGFGLAVQQMFYAQDFMFGSLSGIAVPRPDWAGGRFATDTGYYYFVLAVTAVVTLVTLGVTHSRLGRLLRAMADSPTGLAASGASVNVSRVLVFCISASLGALGGVLDGATQGFLVSDQFPPIMSLQLFALLMICVGGAPWFALMAAAGHILVPAYISTDATVTYVFTLLFGVSAVIFAMLPPGAAGAPPAVRRLVERLAPPLPALPGFLRWRRGVRQAPHEEGPPGVATGRGLQAEEITVRFGGLVAVNGVSVEVPTGQITGLIGPNGAGKSTFFGACSGLVRPNAGRVLLNGRSLARTGPPQRARRGLGRTFQQMELFDSLTVADNVALGREAGYAGFNPLQHLAAWPGQRREIRERSLEALELCGITGLADRPVGSLATGERRLVELARCVAGRFDVLLLDEPSSGLDKVETEQFGEILTDLVARRGVGILLVEHDMSLVTRVCSNIHVLDFGNTVAHGPIAEVMARPDVQAAYLGKAPDRTDCPVLTPTSGGGIE